MRRPISTIVIALAATVSAGLVSACAAERDAGPQYVELCRPDTVPDQPLTIGNLEIAPGSFDARLSVHEAYGAYGVHITLDEADAQRLAILTRSRLNERLPLKIGEVLISEPIVRTPILDGRILISGNFTRLGAEDVVRQISPPCLRLATSDETLETDAPAGQSAGPDGPAQSDSE